MNWSHFMLDLLIVVHFTIIVIWRLKMFDTLTRDEMADISDNNYSSSEETKNDSPKGKSSNCAANIPDDLLFSLLDNSYESLILIDADGIIRFISKGNEGFSSISVKDSVGRHITEVRPNTRLPRVIKTGKAEIGRSMLLNQQNRIIARIPLFNKEGRIIGAMGKMMFMSLEKFKQLYERIHCLENQIDYYKEELNQSYGISYTFDNIIGRSEAIMSCKALARKAAQSDASVLITGESGTGKELFAHSIHQISKRNKYNFVRVNCASIPSELIESELFGYEPGAFTGAAKKGKAGKFELADRGTIFLDEIGDMPPLLQVKLMRVLQEKEVERIGGKPKNIDFRVISATNRDLNKMVTDKSFRLDLYYRLNVFVITLPPLRDMREDIPQIFHHFLDKLNRGNRQKITNVSREAMEALQNYSWPGNLRELRNIADRSMILCSGNTIQVEDLPISLREKPRASLCEELAGDSLKEIMENTEKKAILDALERAGNNREKASSILKIHRTGLYQKMKKYNIS